MRALALFGLLCIACEDPVREGLADTGPLCLYTRADGALQVVVQFPVCLSSTCDRPVSENCSVERSGNELRVSSRLVWEASLAEDCTADCLVRVASCVLPEVEAGSYTVSHGAESAIVSLPTDERVFLGNAGALICTDAPSTP
jgi:hypothetical protein